MNKREIRDHKFKLIMMLSFFDDYDLDEVINNYIALLPFDDEEDTNDYTGKLYNKYKKVGYFERKKNNTFKDGRDEEEFKDNIKEIKDFIKDFNKNKNEITEILIKAIHNWNIKFIPRCEKYILMLAVYEMLYDDSISHKVAINEAVMLAQNYGNDEKADRFVNAVLGEVYKDKIKIENRDEDFDSNGTE